MNRLFDLIGNTPLVSLDALHGNKNVKLLGKLEGNNPGGSVKDRPAYNMIAEARRRGELNSNITLIEATSGNTGIALALCASIFHQPIELVMPENSTKERIATMEAFGAKVILTPAEDGMEGAIEYTRSQVAKGGYLMLNQFANPDNPLAHYKTTGPEIWRDTSAQVSHFVSSMGTTGTIMGVSRFLKEQNEDIQIIGAQPSEGSRIPGIRKWPEAYLPQIFDARRVDRILEVSEEEARTMTNTLARTCGVFAGMSSGGNVATALRIVKELDTGVVVVIICDRGDRYLSSDLF